MEFIKFESVMSELILNSRSFESVHTLTASTSGSGISHLMATQFNNFVLFSRIGAYCAVFKNCIYASPEDVLKLKQSYAKDKRYFQSTGKIKNKCMRANIVKEIFYWKSNNSASSY